MGGTAAHKSFGNILQAVFAKSQRNSNSICPVALWKMGSSACFPTNRDGVCHQFYGKVVQISFIQMALDCAVEP